eukprot:1777958-Rhodomonas_salina.2
MLGHRVSGSKCVAPYTASVPGVQRARVRTGFRVAHAPRQYRTSHSESDASAKKRMSINTVVSSRNLLLVPRVNHVYTWVRSLNLFA